MYNIICFVGGYFIGLSLARSLFISFLVSLVLLYVVLMTDLMEKLNKEKVNCLEKEKDILRNLRGEYMAIHRMKLKNFNSSNTSPFNKDSLVHNVHLDYLQNISKKDSHPIIL